MAEFKAKEIIVRLESDKKGTKIIGKQCGEIVRCKDCKHRPILEDPIGKQYGFNVIAPEDEHGWKDDTCPYLVDDGFYSRYPNDDDFCSCGERRTE